MPPLTNCVEGSAEAGFPDEIAPRAEDYVFLKRRPSAFYGTGVAELLHMLRRDTIVIGGGATNRGVETSVREAFNMDIDIVVVRECCWSGDAAAHAYSLDKAMKMYAHPHPRPGRRDAGRLRRGLGGALSAAAVAGSRTSAQLSTVRALPALTWRTMSSVERRWTCSSNASLIKVW